MAEPVHPALARVFAELQRAGGSLLIDRDSLPEQQIEHDAALVAMIDALNRFYLHTDALTGLYDPAPLYLDKSRVVFGLYAGAVEPLITFLERRSDVFTAWINANELSLAPTEREEWGSWLARLDAYRTTVDRLITTNGRDKPSEELWRFVTAPLLQGLYPSGVPWPGISSPDTPQKPDITTLPTTMFVSSLYVQTVSPLQLWLAGWGDSVETWMMTVGDWIDHLFATLRAGLDDAFGFVKSLVALGLLGLAGALVFRFVRREPPHG